MTADYGTRLPSILLAEVIYLLDRYGISRPDDDPRRSENALLALQQLADAIAGPLPPTDGSA